MTVAERLAEVRRLPLPSHVALIMDGNGRWAESRSLPRTEGHRQGAKAAERVARFVGEERLCTHLSLFAFSTENWGRPVEEVGFLFALLERFIGEQQREFVERGVRLRVLGALEALPLSLRQAIAETEERTRDGLSLHLAVGINFGGRWSVLHGARRAAELAREGKLDPAQLDEAAFARLLPTANLPDPDLIVRTGDEMRISNFYLWEAAYSELHFTATLWPDFDEESLLSAIRGFQSRRRRFGRVAA